MANPKYFRPELNKPYTLALKYPQGRPVSGQAGPELCWTLTDGRWFYTPLDFAGKLEAIGITKAFQKFEAIRQSNGRKADWILSRTSVAGEAEPGTTKRGSTSDANVSTPARQNAIALIEQAGALDAPHGLEGSMHASAINGHTDALETALKTAVSAAAQAERHGQSIGYTVRFSPADIRALGITAFIQNGRAA